jgi:hypothetical protein
MSTRRKYLQVLITSVLLLVGFGSSFVGASQPIGGVFPINEENYDQVHAAVAYNSLQNEYMVVWHNEWPGNKDIYGQLVSGDGHRIGVRFLVSVGPDDRYLPDIAYNRKTNQYLVVWEQYDGGRPNIRAKLFDAAGQGVSGETTLGTGPALRNRTAPAVAYAYTADRYFVVWQSHVQGNVSDDIEAQVLLASANPDGGNFVVAQGTWQESHGQPDLAYNRARNEFLVVWRREDKNAGVHDIVGMRYKMAGGVGPLDPAFPIASQSGALLQQVSNPTVAAIPRPAGVGQYLVVWERLFLPGDRDILGQRIKGDDRSLEGPPGFSFIDINALSHEDTFDPAVDGNEHSEQYLVAWSLPVGATTGVSGRTVLMNGSQDPKARIWEHNAERAAVVGGRGTSFLLAFDAVPPPYSTARNIYGHLWGSRVYLPLVVRK